MIEDDRELSVAAYRMDPSDPGAALGAGRRDASLVLASWLLRRSFLPLALLGLVLGVVNVSFVSFEETSGGFADALEALRSPFWLLYLAVGVRLAAAAWSLVLAWPLATEAQHLQGGTDGIRLVLPGTWSDRVTLAQAYRAWRWTNAVRREAADRLGTVGTWLRWTDRLFSVLSPVLFVSLFVVLTRLAD